MGKKVTLGGERLGSGNKMQVYLHNFGRSSHNVGMLFKTDQAAGTLVPCFVDVATNGTDYYIDLASKVRTLPTNGPIFGAFKHQIDVFSIPIRLYIAALHNNALGVGLKMQNIKLPTVSYRVQATENGRANQQQVSQDSLTAYLGIRGFGKKDESTTAAIAAKIDRTFPAIFELAYWDIYKNYYANKQEEIGMVISNLNAESADDSAEVLEKLTSIQYGTTISNTANLITTWTYASNYTTNSSGDQQQHGNRLRFNFSEAITQEQFESLLISQGGEKIKQYVRINVFVSDNNLTIQNSDSGKQWILNWSAGAKEVKYEPGPDNINMLKAGTGNTEIGDGRDFVNIAQFPLENIDQMREEILKAPKTVPYSINTFNKLPYTATFGRTQTDNEKEPEGNACFFSQAGLGLKTYLSDRFNNWLSTEWIDGENGINEITAVAVEDGKITMDALILQKKIYDMMNRIAVSGGSYNDWQEAVYGQKTIRLAESPIYEGGMSSEIVFDEVVQTGADPVEDGANPLGSLAGRGADRATRGGKSIHVHVEEPSILMIIESITPRIDYCQGNKWFTQLQTMNDLHKPNLDAIGFQELITEEMAAFDTVVKMGEVNEEGTYDALLTKFSAGKQPSWIQYMTNISQSFGSFASGNELDFMALNREYEQDEETGRIKDLTTYIDPVKFNIAFADAALTAKNFWVQIGMDITARRVMSAKQIPNL